MRRLTAAMLTVMVLAAAGATAWAQESVVLRLKFTPNETLRYRLYAQVTGWMRMDMPMPPEMAMQGPVPLEMVIQGDGIARVLRVDSAGGARMRVHADNLSAKMQIMGERIEFSVAGDQYTVMQNGRPVEAGKIPLLPGDQKIPFLQAPIEAKVGPRGEMLDLAMPGLGEMIPGMSMQDLMKDQMLLPEQPLVVGQTWQETKTETLPGFTSPVVTNVRMTLNSIETWSGDRKVANIRVEATTSAQNVDLAAAAAAAGQQAGPPVAGTASINQQLAGTMVFDATRGILVRFDFQVDQQMNMRMQAEQQSMAMDMQFTVKGAVAKK